MAKVYEVNGVEVKSLKEVAELLGVARVSTKDILSGQYPDVYINDTEDVETTADLVEEFTAGLEGAVKDLDDEYARRQGELDHAEESSYGEELLPKFEVIEVGDAPTDGVLTNVGDTPKVLTNEEGTDDVEPPTDPYAGRTGYGDDASDNPALDTEYPEVGFFEDEKAMKKYIKKLSNEELAEWCELEGATYKANSHEAINRMRQAMAIKAIHFPDTAPKAGKAKSKSKYADYSTEDLVQMALDNDVEIKDDKGDARILRMYTIMALRKAGLIS